jgi:hypothetical protein
MLLARAFASSLIQVLDCLSFFNPYEVEAGAISQTNSLWEEDDEGCCLAARNFYRDQSSSPPSKRFPALSFT